MQTILGGNKWRWALAAALAAVFAAASPGAAEAQLNGRLLPRQQVARLGLTRAWFAQVQLDKARAHVERAILAGDQLLVLTSAGTLQSINALTGETLWVAPFGDPEHPSLGPTANDQFVALVNGSTLYVLDRLDGRPVIVRSTRGVPGAAPALSREYCFVPMATGRIEGYPVRDQKLAPWYYQSYGQAMVAPLVTDLSVVWSTDRGFVYVGDATHPGIRYRLETSSEIVAPPAFRRPFVFAATISGEIFAVHESTGARRWKFAAGYPILRAPAAVGARVFVTTLKPALYAVDAATGDALWEAPNIAQFAAASHERVYAMDGFGSLVVLDAASGATLNRMATDGNSDALVNDQTDRLYLVSDDGLVQCLHELGADQPLYHNPPETEPTQEADSTTTPRPTTPPETVAPQPRTNPDAENPFGNLGGASGGAAPGGGAPNGAGPGAGDAGDGGNPFDFDR